MKTLLIGLLCLISLNTLNAAEIKCFGDSLDLRFLQSCGVDILEVVYYGKPNKRYSKNLCAVEHIEDMCFDGDKEEAATLLEAYLKYTYEFYEDVNGIFVQQLEPKKDALKVYYTEQWNSHEVLIHRCRD